MNIGYLLRRYVAIAAKDVQSLRDKSIHPHSLRHSTAIALMKSGVDFAMLAFCDYAKTSMTQSNTAYRDISGIIARYATEEAKSGPPSAPCS